MFESHYLDITVLAVYLLLCLCIGLYKAFSVKTLKTFAIGNGNLPSSILVLTIFCTAFGAGAIIGYSENIYISGTLYICCMLFTPLFWLITAWIFVQNIERFSGCLSISEIMYRLYGSPGRWVTSVVSIIFSIGVLAAHATAIGYIFHYFFDISPVSGILISYGVLAVYSALGGIRAVVLTEIFSSPFSFLSSLFQLLIPLIK